MSYHHMDPKGKSWDYQGMFTIYQLVRDFSIHSMIKWDGIDGIWSSIRINVCKSAFMPSFDDYLVLFSMFLFAKGWSLPLGIAEASWHQPHGQFFMCNPSLPVTVKSPRSSSQTRLRFHKSPCLLDDFLRYSQQKSEDNGTSLEVNSPQNSKEPGTSGHPWKPTIPTHQRESTDIPIRFR